MTRPPASHSARYGVRHRELRAQLAARVESGLATCARCGLPIRPGEAWDLGHRDGGGPREYSGAEHARCNRATRPLIGERRVSRDW
jgi:hypothetical protein